MKLVCFPVMASSDASHGPTWVQRITYFGVVATGSIALLVFLNATISFVITNIIQQTVGVGDATGTLGFADELVAIVACPVWGLISDRIGVTHVIEYAADDWLVPC